MAPEPVGNQGYAETAEDGGDEAQDQGREGFRAERSFAERGRLNQVQAGNLGVLELLIDAGLLQIFGVLAAIET